MKSKRIQKRNHMICLLYENGQEVDDIALVFGIKTKTVSRIVRGVAVRCVFVEQYRRNVAHIVNRHMKSSA